MAPLFYHTTWMAPGRGTTHFPKSAGMRKPYAFSFGFLTGIAFFWPGYGGAHPGRGANGKP